MERRIRQTGDVAPHVKRRRGGVFAAAAADEPRSPEPCGLRGRTGFVHGARPPAIPSAPDFLSAKPADGILKQVSVPRGMRAAKVQQWNTAPQCDNSWIQPEATCVHP